MMPSVQVIALLEYPNRKSVCIQKILHPLATHLTLPATYIIKVFQVSNVPYIRIDRDESCVTGI